MIKAFISCLSQRLLDVTIVRHKYPIKPIYPWVEYRLLEEYKLTKTLGKTAIPK